MNPTEQQRKPIDQLDSRPQLTKPKMSKRQSALQQRFSPAPALFFGAAPVQLVLLPHCLRAGWGPILVPSMALGRVRSQARLTGHGVCVCSRCTSGICQPCKAYECVNGSMLYVVGWLRLLVNGMELPIGYNQLRYARECLCAREIETRSTCETHSAPIRIH